MSRYDQHIRAKDRGFRDNRQADTLPVEEDILNDSATEAERRSYVRMRPTSGQSRPRRERRPRTTRMQDTYIEPETIAPPAPFYHQPPSYNMHNGYYNPPGLPMHSQAYQMPYPQPPAAQPLPVYGGSGVPPGPFQAPWINGYPDPNYPPSAPLHPEVPYPGPMDPAHYNSSPVDGPENNGHRGYRRASSVVSGSSTSSMEQEMSRLRRQIKKMKEENKTAKIKEEIRRDISRHVDHELSRLQRESNVRGDSDQIQDYSAIRPRANSTELVRRRPVLRAGGERDRESLVYDILDIIDGNYR